jgi:hypothetical protein
VNLKSQGLTVKKLLAKGKSTQGPLIKITNPIPELGDADIYGDLRLRRNAETGKYIDKIVQRADYIYDANFLAQQTAKRISDRFEKSEKQEIHRLAKERSSQRAQSTPNSPRGSLYNTLNVHSQIDPKNLNTKPQNKGIKFDIQGFKAFKFLPSLGPDGVYQKKIKLERDQKGSWHDPITLTESPSQLQKNHTKNKLKWANRHHGFYKRAPKNFKEAKKRFLWVYDLL